MSGFAPRDDKLGTREAIIPGALPRSLAAGPCHREARTDAAVSHCLEPPREFADGPRPPRSPDYSIIRSNAANASASPSAWMVSAIHSAISGAARSIAASSASRISSPAEP